MKRIFFIGLMVLFVALPAGGMIAQETGLSKKEQRRQEKERKKEARQLEDEQQSAAIRSLLSAQRFVFQGSRLFGPGGDSWSLSPNINFLLVADTTVVLQFGFDNLVGWNGVGGITIEGYADSYVFDDGGRKNAMSVTSRIREKNGRRRIYYVLTVMDNAAADLDLTVPGGTLRMNGRIVDPAEAGIFKGEYY